MTNCPTCGRPMPSIRDGDTLAQAMQSAHPAGADCYRGRDGNYYVTHGGGNVSRDAVDDALARGLIVPKWPDTTHEYWRLNLLGARER